MQFPIRPGTHLRTPRGLYDHHGVSLGWICNSDGLVGHLAGDGPKDRTTARIRASTLRDFADGHPVFEVPYGPLPFSREQIVSRMRSLVGRPGYNLVFDNCEHVARTVMTAEHQSRQVDQVMTNLGVPVLAAAGATGAFSLINVVGAPHWGAARLMKGLRALGGPFNLGPAGMVAGLSVIPTLAAGPVIGRWYQDDPYATDQERVARSAARQVATPVALGASLTLTTLISVCGVPGLSAAGVTSGLKVIGSIIGGRMAAGILLTLLTPVGVAAAAAWIVYRAVKLQGSRFDASVVTLR